VPPQEPASALARAQAPVAAPGWAPARRAPLRRLLAALQRAGRGDAAATGGVTIGAAATMVACGKARNWRNTASACVRLLKWPSTISWRVTPSTLRWLVKTS